MSMKSFSYLFAVSAVGLLLNCGVSAEPKQETTTSATEATELGKDQLNNDKKNVENSSPEAQKPKNLWDKIKGVGQEAFEGGKKGVKSVQKTLSESRDSRAATKMTALGHYSLIDTWIPSKIGATFSYNPNADVSYEIEYSRGSMSFDFLVIKDFGTITDQRLSVLKRSFSGNDSFHYLKNLLCDMFVASYLHA